MKDDIGIDKAIILAAGMGIRLNPITNNIPKCLLPIHGKTILENQLECLERGGIKETIVVVGYMKDKIISQIRNQFGRMKISYVENDIFDKTNNIYSLWLARDHLKRGCLLLEGDLFFEEPVIQRLLASPHKNLAVLDIYRANMEGTVVTLSPDRAIEAMILKRNQPDGFDYRDKFKTVNIYKFSPQLARMLGSRLDAHINAGKCNDFYEIILRDIVADGEIALYGLLINDLKWFEIDTPYDLEMTKQLFKQSERSDKLG